jgi:AcrR family transcriptional regulator
MPRLWSETIEAHRRTVRDAILDATAALVAEHGLAAVTMSQIAEAAGIGRATLYKYFADVESILDAWHERQIAGHLAQLAEVRSRAAAAGGGAGATLQAVLEAYALISHEHPHGHSRQHHGADHHAHHAQRHGADLAALLHRDRGEHVARARHQLTAFVCELLAEGAASGELRDDVAPGELAGYCLHALTAAGSLPSKAAVRRLVAVTMAGLQPPRR